MDEENYQALRLSMVVFSFVLTILNIYDGSYCWLPVSLGTFTYFAYKFKENK